MTMQFNQDNTAGYDPMSLDDFSPESEILFICGLLDHFNHYAIEYDGPALPGKVFIREYLLSTLRSGSDVLTPDELAVIDAWVADPS